MLNAVNYLTTFGLAHVLFDKEPEAVEWFDFSIDFILCTYINTFYCSNLV